MSDTHSAFVNDSDIFDKTIRPVPVPEKEIGIDTKEYLFQNIINAAVASKIDVSQIESFTNATQSREQMYQLIDSMSEDSKVAAVLETYAEDTTEYNDEGRIVWVESDNSDISSYINYLLKTLRIDKHIYSWAHSLCKYGDLYLRLYRKSEYDDLIFKPNKQEPLNEDIKIKAYAKNDKYVHYVEMIPDPAQVFELTRFGKTAGYIQTPPSVSVKRQMAQNVNGNYYKYQFNKNDVNIYGATEFVHACLEDTTSRVPEEVDIFITDDEDSPQMSYKVRRGQSLIYSSYKTWRELMLLENSVLLNRITKSSIVRVVGVEVGDMPKEMVGPHLQGIKSMVEQKSAINVDGSMNEYTNPGPIENNIYVPTHDGKGAITISSIGGDVNVKDLADLDYYLNLFYGGLRVPKQFFCLRGNTPILLLDGTIHNLSDLYNDRGSFIGKEIMSCAPDGTLSQTKIKNIMLTKPFATFTRIHLDNGKYVDVTPEHRMMLRDGSFVEAEDLSIGDSLMTDLGADGGDTLVYNITYLKDIEPAYDIEVESDNHTFVLPCGIFVHNCQTDDQTGFNGGTSLSIISSRYAKAVKRIQNTLIQAITDMLNLMLLDSGLDNYVNHFEIHMLPPTTQEEKDRRENVSSRIQLTTDIMNLLSDIDDQATKLRVLKNLLGNVLTDDAVTHILQQEIIRLENERNADEDVMLSDDSEEGTFDDSSSSGGGGFDETTPMDFSSESESSEPAESTSETSDTKLPSPSDLGVDMTEM